jgi:hypothetical protein
MSRLVRRLSAAAVTVFIATAFCLVSSSATGAPSASAGGTTVDIGYTAFSGGAVKESGSCTSQSCLAIYRVYLVIVPNGSEISATEVTRYPSEPSSAKFSPMDHYCDGSTYNYVKYFKTRIKWAY